jgi:Allene oxide cyclase
MKGKVRIIVAAASVCALVIVVALATTALGSTKQTVKVVEHASSDATVDIGATGDSEGDILWFANDVYDSSDTDVVGNDQGECFRTSVADGAWECNWTTFLDGGQITVEGPFYDTADSMLAITGGTGAYKAAQGQMKLHCYTVAGDPVGRCDFVFKLILP